MGFSIQTARRATQYETMKNSLGGKTANLAQSRVRWLSLIGIIGGVAMFCLATALLTWNNSIRRHASLAEDELMECRLAVNRVMSEINRDWNVLLSVIPDPTVQIPEGGEPTWKADLELASKICERLNQHELLQQLGKTVAVSAHPHVDFYNRANNWHHEYSRLRESCRNQLKLTEASLQELLRGVDRLQGQYRLDLAIDLRADFANQPFEEFARHIRQDCYRDLVVTGMRSDITELQLRLTRLASNQNLDQLADLSENQIRPLLLRLNSCAHEYGFGDAVRMVENCIFGTEVRMHKDGFYRIQFALAEHLVKRTTLFEDSCALTDQLNNERSHLAATGASLQGKLNEDFSKALTVVWSAILASGIGFSFAFIWVARRVSADIALQLETIDRSAHELANEQLLLATVISSVPTPLYWKDPTGRYQGCSNTFAKWLGFEHAGDVIGRTDDQLPWEAETAALKCADEERIMNGEYAVFRAEIPKLFVDGRRLVVLANKTPLRGVDGRNMGVLGAYLDISERKAAEEKAAGLAKVMAECPSELYVFETTELRLIELNKAASKAVGIDEVKQNARSFVSINSQLDIHALREMFAPLLRNEKERIEYETVHRRADQSLYPVHVSVLTIELEGLFVFVACATDLTEYKKLERKLAQAQKLESIGQLAAGIAHEINTPMQCISGNIEFLQKFSVQLLKVIEALRLDLQSTSPRPWAERVEELNKVMKKCRYDYLVEQVPMAIDESSQAIRRVIEIVRAMRVMSHPGTKDKVSTDLNSLIQDAITVSRNRWKYAAEVNCDLDPELPSIDALPAELSQVFLNLIVNAADALIEKNGENAAELGTIDITSRVEGQNIVIEVQDNGCGMSEETKLKVFEPFFTTKEVGKGTGQGLTITYDVITKLHGGSVEIDSQLGIGTRFKIVLPRPILTIETPTDVAGVRCEV